MAMLAFVWPGPVSLPPRPDWALPRPVFQRSCGCRFSAVPTSPLCELVTPSGARGGPAAHCVGTSLRGGDQPFAVAVLLRPPSFSCASCSFC